MGAGQTTIEQTRWNTSEHLYFANIKQTMHKWKAQRDLSVLRKGDVVT